MGTYSLFADRYYLNFVSAENAQQGFNILYKEASDNAGFLSYNRFRELVYGEHPNCDPTYGWTLEMLKQATIEPNYHMYVLNMPGPSEFKEKPND